MTMSRRALLVGAPIALTAGVVGPMLTASASQAVTHWEDGRSYGRWECVYNGYGKVSGSDSRVHMAPRAVTRSDQTSACMVRSRQDYSRVLYAATITTTKQLRTGSRPNNWECGWLVWHHQADDKFYYFIPKPNGWELGKVIPGWANGWANDQKFLATGANPVFAVGKPVTVSVNIHGNQMTIDANGRRIVSYRDTSSPYTRGRVGLYTEDAAVTFDRITTRSN